MRPSNIFTVTYGIFFSLLQCIQYTNDNIRVGGVNKWDNEQKPKPKIGFTIIKDDPTDGHKGFGIGSLSLENVSPVVIDVEEEVATIEIGAMHARSPLERGIRFLPTREESANGKAYWLVWVTIDYKKEGPFYSGVTACEMVIDRSIRRGYKNFVDHMNRMDRSMKGQNHGR